jgi:hypothetical protein
VAAVHKPPKVETAEIEILRLDQVKAVLAALDGHALHPIPPSQFTLECAGARSWACNGAT